MKLTVFGAAAMSLIAAAAIAQPATTHVAPGQPSSAGGPAATSPQASRDTAPASDRNQAVANTGQNAATPARGANSFTEGEARSRLESNGYSNISGLSKDENGVWRGQAQKGSQQAQVWLDYKGNVGQQ